MMRHARRAKPIPPPRPGRTPGPSALPKVPYPATVDRPAWTQLPAPVREEINRRSHQPVVAWDNAKAGLTPSFAATLRHADNSATFVKAAPLPADPDRATAQDSAAAAITREARICSRLPQRVPLARLRWHTEAAGWAIAAYDAIDGSTPQAGWSTRHRQTIIDTWQQTAALLRDPSWALRSVCAPAEPLPAGWAAVAANRRRLPAHAAHLTPLAPQLAVWEARFLAECDDATTLAHFDLRPDNTLISHDSRMWIVDWSTLRPGPAHIDAVILAVAASADGSDPQTFFEQAAPDVPPRSLDQALAWLCGAWLTYAAGPDRRDSPHLRALQLRDGLTAWQWLADRHTFPSAPRSDLPLAGRARLPHYPSAQEHC